MKSILLTLLLAASCAAQTFNVTTANVGSIGAAAAPEPPSSCGTAQDGFTGSSDANTTIGADSATETDLYVAIKFTAGSSYTTCSNTVALFKYGSPPFDLTLNIYSHDSTNDSPLAAIASWSTAVSAASLTGGEANWNFPSFTASLTNATAYWLVLKASVIGDGNNFVYWPWHYADGAGRASKSATGAATTWLNISGNAQLKFQLYSE